MKKGFFVLFLGLALTQVAFAADTAASPAGQMGQMGTSAANKSVLVASGRGARARRGDACRSTFSSCLTGCTGQDVNGCIMGCETDCSVCVLEEAGELNSPRCERGRR